MQFYVAIGQHEFSEFYKLASVLSNITLPDLEKCLHSCQPFLACAVNYEFSGLTYPKFYLVGTTEVNSPLLEVVYL
jgi:hypothetical protein